MEVPFRPSRVILQDFTGVPAVVDFAAMRDAVQVITVERGGGGKLPSRSDVIIYNDTIDAEKSLNLGYFLYSIF